MTEEVFDKAVVKEILTTGETPTILKPERPPFHQRPLTLTDLVKILVLPILLGVWTAGMWAARADQRINDQAKMFDDFKTDIKGELAQNHTETRSDMKELRAAIQKIGEGVNGQAKATELLSFMLTHVKEKTYTPDKGTGILEGR